jgi:hypothetical protein
MPIHTLLQVTDGVEVEEDLGPVEDAVLEDEVAAPSFDVEVIGEDQDTSYIQDSSEVSDSNSDDNEDEKVYLFKITVYYSLM